MEVSLEGGLRDLKNGCCLLHRIQMEFVNFLNWILPIESFPLDSLNFEALEAFLMMLE